MRQLIESQRQAHEDALRHAKAKLQTAHDIALQAERKVSETARAAEQKALRTAERVRHELEELRGLFATPRDSTEACVRLVAAAQTAGDAACPPRQVGKRWLCAGCRGREAGLGPRVGCPAQCV